MDADDRDVQPEQERCRCELVSPHRARLPEVVDRLLDEIDRRETVQRVCECPLPSGAVVVRILDLLFEVLFPGYFGRTGLDRPNLAFYIGRTLNDVHDLLSTEISRCMLHDRPTCTEGDRAQCAAEGERLAFEFLAGLPDLLAALDGDVRAAFEGDPAATGYDEVVFCYPGFRAVTIYRLAHGLHEQGVPWLPRMMTEHAHRITGMDVHPAARIGHGFFVDHATGVVIGETTEIGDNVRMYQGVTLGGFRFRTDAEGHLLRAYKRHPTIEDDVVIYAHASILGPITVGQGSVIGANVFLTDSVPPGSHVTVEQPENRIQQRGEDAPGH